MRKQSKHGKELIFALILSAIYGLSVLITGQACAITYCQPHMPSKLYKISNEENEK